MQAITRERQLEIARVPPPDDVARVARLGAVVASLVPQDYVAGTLVALGRRAHGMTQAELAERIGVARSTLGAMETAAQRISERHAGDLARILVIPPDLLTTR